MTAKRGGAPPTAHVRVFVRVVAAVVFAVTHPRVKFAQGVIAHEFISPAKESTYGHTKK